MKNMLIADDNEQIRSILAEYAKKEGYTVFAAGDGGSALEIFLQQEIDVALLDVMMPVMDGFELCRKIRAISDVPIIMVTARGEDFERIMGLDIGADDYIVKPFSPGEVMARVRAVLRRAVPEAGQPREVSVSNLTLDIEKFTAKMNDDPLSLTKKEFDILYTLSTNPGKVFSRDNLLNSLWGYDYYGDTRTVDSHIKRLRAKLDEYIHPDWDIKTVWGVGYKFEVENEQ